MHNCKSTLESKLTLLASAPLKTLAVNMSSLATDGPTNLKNQVHEITMNVSRPIMNECIIIHIISDLYWIFIPSYRGNLWVPPPPGMMASRVSTRPIFASSEATRRSHARAISRPPPVKEKEAESD